MLWVLVAVALAVLSLVAAGSYAVWLAHKLSDVWSEVRVLTERGARLAELLGQIGAPVAPGPDTSGEHGQTPGVAGHL
jgi:hypothetical protein